MSTGIYGISDADADLVEVCYWVLLTSSSLFQYTMILYPRYIHEKNDVLHK